MADEVDLDEALDALYATPPEDFVSARNGLTKALKAAGQKKKAAEVAALRKPNRLVWALDQLALDDDASLAPLLDAADVIRFDAADDLRSAMAELREAVSAAAGAAAGRLDARPSDRADLAAALLTVVADDRARDQLSLGRLQEIPAPDAFGLGPGPAAFSKAAAAPATKSKPKPKPKADGATDRPPDQLAIRRAEKRRKEAAKEADAAERARARAEKAAAAEAERLAQADQARADATGVVAEAEEALEEARQDLAAAEKAAAEAVDAQERAAGTLAEAQGRAEAAAAALEDATAERDALEP